MTLAHHNKNCQAQSASHADGLLLLADPAYIWAGARLTSCGFMAASAAS